MLPEVLRSVEIIHQCGPREANGDYPRLIDARSRLPGDLAARYHPVERLGAELQHVYAAASVVAGRAGAGTVSELAALGIPAILIPLPGAVEQRLNAEALAESATAIVLDQDDLDHEQFLVHLDALISCHEDRAERTTGDASAVRRLLDEIIELSKVQR